MCDFFGNLLKADFIPHGHCYYWEPVIVWLHLISDAIIALAYFSIPFALVYFVRRRKDLEFRWAFVLFAIFILSCGANHVMLIITLWHPIYRLEGTLKAITAISSIATAIALWPLIPQALRLPGPTEMKNKNRELRAMANELENRVEDRTRALARSNKQLEDYAYLASHDLQEPLRMVTMYMQLIEENQAKHFDEEGQRHLKHAIHGANRMQSMVRAMLDFSRIGSESLLLEKVELSHLIDQVLLDLTASIESSSARISVNAKHTVLADRSLIGIVLQNLISNAIKYGPRDGQPDIQIHSELVENKVLIHVRDNGIGIAPEQYERIFQLFQRLHKEEDYPGTGMGLAICRKIIDEHGGSISIRANQEGGSIFTCSLQAG